MREFRAYMLAVLAATAPALAQAQSSAPSSKQPLTEIPLDIVPGQAFPGIPEGPIPNTFPIGEGYSVWAPYVEYTGRDIVTLKDGQKQIGNTNIVFDCGWDLDARHQPKLTGYYNYTSFVVGPNQYAFNLQLMKLGTSTAVIRKSKTQAGATGSQNVDVQVFDNSTGASISAKQCVLSTDGQKEIFSGCSPIQPFTSYNVVTANDGKLQQACLRLWGQPYTLDGKPLEQAIKENPGYYDAPARDNFYKYQGQQLEVLANQ